jgi:hypothetical protein
MRGFDTFSKDPDICDACINLNHTKRWWWGTPDQLFAVVVGQYLAFIISLIVVLRHRQFRGMWRLRGFWAKALLALVVPCVVCVWLFTRLLHLISILRGQGEARKRREANPIMEADRFYWLAVWGRVTGRERFSRRMLKRAMRLGAVDVRSLASKG